MVSHTHIPMGQLYPFGVGLCLLFQPGSPEPQRSSELKFLRLFHTRSFQELMDTENYYMIIALYFGIGFFIAILSLIVFEDDPDKKGAGNFITVWLAWPIFIIPILGKLGDKL